jgi:hypothetical protein
LSFLNCAFEVGLFTQYWFFVEFYLGFFVFGLFIVVWRFSIWASQIGLSKLGFYPIWAFSRILFGLFL